jgi:hypothetical protein
MLAVHDSFGSYALTAALTTYTPVLQTLQLDYKTGVLLCYIQLLMYLLTSTTAGLLVMQNVLPHGDTQLTTLLLSVLFISDSVLLCLTGTLAVMYTGAVLFSDSHSLPFSIVLLLVVLLLLLYALLCIANTPGISV